MWWCTAAMAEARQGDHQWSWGGTHQAATMSRRATHQGVPARPEPPSDPVVQIVCCGSLPREQRVEFREWRVCCTGGVTVLIGKDIDQAGPHGALDRLALLGVHVTEVSRQPGQTLVSDLLHRATRAGVGSQT